MDGRSISSTPDTSPSLLLRIRDPEDKLSWEIFERVYGQIVRSYCRHWKLQECDAEDVTQDVLAHIAVAIRVFEYDPTKGRFRGWLGTVTANRIKNLLRKKRRETTHESLIDPDESPHHCVDPDSTWVELFSGKIFAEASRSVRVEFEETTWKCFELTWLRQTPPLEVAHQLGVSVRAVYINKSRVLRRLETEIRMLANDLAVNEPGSYER